MHSIVTNTVIAIASVAIASGIVAFADPANADVPGGQIHRAVCQANAVSGGANGRCFASASDVADQGLRTRIAR